MPRAKFCSRRCLTIYKRIRNPNKETSIEKTISTFLTEKEISFKSQYPFLNKYLVDFFLPQYKLIIEADGDYWHNLPGVPEKDRQRDKEAKEAGYTTLRLKEKDLKQHGAALVAQEMYKITNQPLYT